MSKIKTNLKIATKIVLFLLVACLGFTNVYAGGSSGFANGADETYISLSKTFKGIPESAIPSNFYISLYNDENVLLHELRNQPAENVTFESGYDNDGNVMWTWKISELTTGTYHLEEHGEEIQNYVVNTEISGQTADGGIEVSSANITIEVHEENTNNHDDWPFSDTKFFIAPLTGHSGVLIVTMPHLTAAERAKVEHYLRFEAGNNTFNHEPFIYYSLEANGFDVNGEVSTHTITIGTITVTYYRDIADWKPNPNDRFVKEGSGIVIDGKAWMHTGIGIIDYGEGRNADIRVTNTYEYNLKNITVTKRWDDDGNRDGLRTDSVTVELLKNNGETGNTVILNESNQWSGSFADLPVYDDNDNLIPYDLKEIIPEGSTLEEYDWSIEAGETPNSYVVVNKHTPEEKTLTVNKTWDDNDNANNTRPSSITINLYADYVEGAMPFATHVMQPDENGIWKPYTFEHLKVYRSVKIPIIYTITEEPLENYYANIKPTDSGYDIENIYKRVTKPIDIVKEWNGYNPDPGDDITVVVSSENVSEVEDSQPIDLSLNNYCEIGTTSSNWNCQLNMPKYYFDLETGEPTIDPDTGELVEINYTVSETKVKGFSFDENNVAKVYHNEIPGLVIGVWQSEVDGLVITNTWNPKSKRSLSLTKVTFGSGEQPEERSGAVFDLYMYIGENINNADLNNLVATDWYKIGSTTSNPQITFNDLYAGTYRLVETKAPYDCILPSGWWKVTIADDMTIGDYVGINNPPGIDKNLNLIYNEKIPIMPETGGVGANEITIIGLILMTIGIIFQLVYRRNEI